MGHGPIAVDLPTQHNTVQRTNASNGNRTHDFSF